MSMRACADADVLKFAFSHTALMPHHRTARTLHQTGDSGISRAMRRVALFVLVAGVGFLVWVLLDYANELSIADKLRGVLGIVVFSYAIANALIYYVRFTEDGIEQRSTFGRIRFYRYEDLESFQVTITDTRIYLLGGKKLTIKRFEGNRHRISEILEGHGVSRVD